MYKVGSSGNDKRADIVDAARHLGLRYGMKGVTVEAIAREARVAKPTVYAYFSNKDEIFAGVMERLIEDMRHAFVNALAGDGSLSHRAGAAIAAKHAETIRLLAGSPYADELYSEHDRIAGPQFRALEEFIEREFVREFTEAGLESPREMAQLFMAATHGVSLKARSLEQLTSRIDLLARRLLDN